jgi:hypothetical protein
MNERERWIVYPLLFFALGASLRDKFLQQVHTKEFSCEQLTAKQILCDELAVRDPSQANRIVAQLTSGTLTAAGANAERFGVLFLYDSEGRELCGVANNALQVRQIHCDEVQSKAVSVLDPLDENRRIALLTATPAPTPEKPNRRVGTLALTDDEGAEVFGLKNDSLQMRNIACQGIAVLDPADQTRVLAILGSALVRQNEQSEPERIGVLQLNDQRLITLRGNPTQAPVDSPPPPAAAAPAEPAPEEAAEEGPAEPAAPAEGEAEPAAAEESAVPPAEPAPVAESASED